MKKLKQHKGKKLKYQAGGYNANLNFAEDQSASNQSIEQAGTSAVSSIPGLGPLWGALAGIGTEASKKIIGDGQSTGNNVMGDIANPFNQFKNNKNFGDWAMSFGLPGVSSFVKGKRMKSEAAERENVLQNQRLVEARVNSDSIMANYNSQGVGLKEFKSGGMLVGGGSLQPISDNAFEVEGNNPGKTDDVNIGQAFVDDEEVIKSVGDGLQIFSATLKVPGTERTFSQEAKKLEKQKTEQTDRFPEQNNLVERKLQNLFSMQQLINGNNTGETTAEAIVPAGESPGKGFSHGDGSMFQKGGLVPEPGYSKIVDLQKIIKPVDNTAYTTWEKKNMPWTDPDRQWFGGDTALGKGENLYITDAGNLASKPVTKQMPRVKTRVDLGDEIVIVNNKNGEALLPSKYNAAKQDNTSMAVNKKLMFLPGKFQTGGYSSMTSDDDPASFAGTQGSAPTSAAPAGKNVNWNMVGNMANALGPGILNFIRSNKLPKPGKPRLDTPVQLSKVDYSDVSNSHNRNLALQLRAADQASVNPNISPALKALAFGQHGENLNRMFGETSRVNAQIANQQAGINQEVQARNNLKLQGYDDSLAARRANQLGLQSQITNSMATNVSTVQRENNQRKLDLRNAEMYEAYLETVAPGLLERHKQLAIEKNTAAPETKTENSNVKGGKVLLKTYRLGGSLRKKKMLC